MAPIVDIAAWRAKRIAAQDVPMGAPPFALVEPCPGCGADRVSTMVWRTSTPGVEAIPFPRIEPHYLCRDGHVLYQDITDAPMPVASWTSVMGRFRD
ncbi:MAG TPA: hypothetical protein VIZ58_09115 [Thermoanaerobaculia bacterium]